METYHGFVRTPLDAIILFEACRLGILPRVQRRLSEKERHSIRSGSVFVWDEREAGMRRWTDGKSWSASRVSGSFLTYREMVGKERSNSTTSNNSNNGEYNTPQQRQNEDTGEEGYVYKPDGLMKQSFSITTSTNLKLHLISYFSRQHFNSNSNSNETCIPTQDPTLKSIVIPKGLYPDASAPIDHSIHWSPPTPQHPVSIPLSHSGAQPPPQSQPQTHIQHQHPHHNQMYRNPYMAPPAQVMHTLQPPSNSSPPFQSILQSTAGHPGGFGLPGPPPPPPPPSHSHYSTPDQSRHAPPPPLHHSQHNNQHSPPQQHHQDHHQNRHNIPNLPPPNIPRNGRNGNSTTSPDQHQTQHGLNAQDIPYEKVTFGEDQRAIQVLDRRFIL